MRVDVHILLGRGGPRSIGIMILFFLLTSTNLLSSVSLSWTAPLAIGIGGAYLLKKWQNNDGFQNGEVIFVYGACLHACMYVCMYVRMCVCVCVCDGVCVCINFYHL